MADRWEIRRVIFRIAHGQALDLVRFGDGRELTALATVTELDDYTYFVAGSVGEFWTRLCERHLAGKFAKLPEAEMLRLGKRFGQGLQLINILRDLPEDLAAGRSYLPTDELVAAGLTVDDLDEIARQGAQADREMAARDGRAARRRLEIRARRPRMEGALRLRAADFDWSRHARVAGEGIAARGEDQSSRSSARPRPARCSRQSSASSPRPGSTPCTPAAANARPGRFFNHRLTQISADFRTEEPRITRMTRMTGILLANSAKFVFIRAKSVVPLSVFDRAGECARRVCGCDPDAGSARASGRAGA